MRTDTLVWAWKALSPSLDSDLFFKNRTVVYMNPLWMWTQAHAAKDTLVWHHRHANNNLIGQRSGCLLFSPPKILTQKWLNNCRFFAPQIFSAGVEGRNDFNVCLFFKDSLLFTLQIHSQCLRTLRVHSVAARVEGGVCWEIRILRKSSQGNSLNHCSPWFCHKVRVIITHF